MALFEKGEQMKPACTQEDFLANEKRIVSAQP
jgi:hypothetical protein